MWYSHRTPILLQWLYPSLIWHQSRSKKSIYLTFDDGPIPEITPLVLEILNQYQIKATFFCVGDNVVKHRNVLVEIIKAGHQIGNHTQHHLNGWNTDLNKYLKNIALCDQQLSGHIKPKSPSLFRPPYGKMSLGQIKRIRDSHKIVMWDVLSGDFDSALSREDCLQNTIKATQNGSIIIFHDSLKARNNLIYALPLYIEHCIKQGYEFKTL